MAVIHPEPNVLFIIHRDDVVVARFVLFPSPARTIIGELRKLTTKPEIVPATAAVWGQPSGWPASRRAGPTPRYAKAGE